MTKLLRKLRHPAGIFVLTILFLSGISYPGQAEDLPEAAYVTGVVGHAQRYVLSCESRSAVDWAAYWGIHIDETEFLMGLPRSDNPDVGFVGNANDAWGSLPPFSYGVHADPVANLLQKYGIEADAQVGLGWDDLRAEIAAGRPVIVWIIGQMWPGSSRDYTASDGHKTRVASFEHTMILIGYGPASVQVVDASTGWTQTYPLGSFLTSWGTLGNMAVTGYLEGGEQHLEPDQVGDSYTVKQGDYLMELARRFNTSWTELATLNNIPYPFTIHPGQVLSLPGFTRELETPQKNETPPPVEEISTRVEANPYTHVVHLPMIFGKKPVVEPVKAERDEPPSPQTYLVQPGEYLVELARRFELDWGQLAELNGIAYPYVIYPGQELKLP